jgi:starch synthase (maltosyl-transferring)
MESHNAYAPRILYLHPALIGPLAQWPAHFERAARLGFDHVAIATPFLPGSDGNLHNVADHRRVHPAFATDEPASDLLQALAQAAGQRGLKLLIDIAPARFAADGVLPACNPHWFQSAEAADAWRDPRRPPPDRTIAYANFQEPDVCAQWADWWSQHLVEWADAGVSGFRIEGPHRVPAGVWRAIRSTLAQHHPQARLLAWTCGISRDDLRQLPDATFDSVFSSLRWWDFRSSWYLDEHEALTRIAAPIAFPEEPLGTRLVHDFTDTWDAGRIERAYRRAIRASATLGTGWLMPMGFEYGVASPLPLAGGSPADYHAALDAQRFDLSADVIQANALLCNTPELATNGPLAWLSGPDNAVSALLRVPSGDARVAEQALLVLANPNLTDPVRVTPARLLDGIPGGFTRFKPVEAPCDSATAPLRAFAMPSGDLAVLRAFRERPVLGAPAATRRGGKTTAEKKALADALAAPRIAIENVEPRVDNGEFAVKRVVGETVEASADIFGEGHDKIAAALLYRAADESDWHEAPMRAAGNDRWVGRFMVDRLGRHEFTVIAWRDDWATLVDHIEKKRRAGQGVDLELDEARALMLTIAKATDELDTEADHAYADEARALATQFDRADATARLELALSQATRSALDAARYRPFLSRDAQIYRIDVDRATARFASWYELFPRSMSDDPRRHGTFDDVITKLPRIRDMGFDVLYFPPIHPIGTTNRKGRNNTLTAAEDDVGSPYATGDSSGGHTAIHPQLGGLDAFNRLLEAAHAHGMEIALDFAIQCSPDHPWLVEHPSWFAWRPDGTLRYAENPPKKYEDIVNPDFYADDAKPALWIALRDVILFWIAAGVRTFRVDNPHTKPLPFWEWMIADVRARHPDVIFLSEAFTRPKLMYRLAKLGFSQSYTYFTWRESKHEFTEYLEELTRTAPKEFFRPHFFVNTPDINPHFLQVSGRAGFVIRAALAATLSGLWGVYCGFELCESTPLPRPDLPGQQSEEYLDSEKYQLRAWDWQRPANIVAEITALNRVRRANPALHTHLGLTFLPAHNDHVIFFEKATRTRDNVVLVAINLDPHHAQSAHVELPWRTLDAWHVAEWDALAVEDQVTGERFEWHGRRQTIHLDPATRAFAIWRIAPLAARTHGLPLPDGENSE